MRNAPGALSRHAATLRRKGRGPDSELVHVSPRERQAMRRMFGPETTNPSTGLPEHFLGELLDFATSAGGDLGGWASDALDLGLSPEMASALGNSVIGGGLGYLMGGDAKSALLGAGAGGLGGYFMPDVRDWLATQDLIPSLGDGTSEDPMSDEDATRGMAMRGDNTKSDEEVEADDEEDPSFFQKYKKPLLLGGGALLLASLLNRGGGSSGGQSGPPAGFAPVRTDRAPINVGLAPRSFQGGAAPGVGQGSAYGTRPEPRYYASGGSVSGPGGGRDDLVPAMLSNNEHVLDAEFVALAGDGSPDEGHRKIEQLKRELRRKKGGALAQGRHSPNAGRLRLRGV